MKVVVVPEKKRAETAEVVVARVKDGFKQISYTDISSTKSVKLSKNVVPRAIAFAL
jgi:hypothetical protein